MLHVQRHAQYVQRVFTPAAAPNPAAGTWLAGISRLRGTGSFDLEHVSAVSGLHIIQSGAGWLSVDGGRAEPLAPGDIFALVASDRARYREDPQRPWRYTWLPLHGSAATTLLSQIGFMGSVRILRQAAMPALWRICDDAEAAYAATTCSPFTPAVLALRIAEALLPAGSPAEPADPAVALRLIIDAGYEGDLTVGGAAGRLGVNRSTLFRRFRTNYGCGPRAYLQQVRLDRARELLRRGGTTVKAIATTCGYDDHRAFARAYKARFGENPSKTMG
ncbi:MAG: AraC family transcriptional regulator [Planctomycetota bacterium]